MKYIALLRGINVGGHRKVDMKKLKLLFESLGFTHVSTYLNSGNILFECPSSWEKLQKDIPQKLREQFGLGIPTLVKTEKEMKHIAKAIPENWKNDKEQKTDVAYLFPEIDSPEIVDTLPVKREFLNLRYIPGALIWNVKRTHYNKSQLNKIIRLKHYQLMTIRNVNTARFLAGHQK